MQQVDFQRFKNLMNGMAKLYERELDAAVMDAYWLALGGWEFADFEAAAAQLMRTSKFMPRPADFHELRKSGKPTSGEVWAKVLHFARHEYSPSGLRFIGDDGKPKFDHVVMKAVEAIGGFRAIAMSETSATPFLERRFCEHFASIQDAYETREAVPQLLGQPESKPKLSGPRRLLG